MGSHDFREVFTAYLHDPPEKPYLIMYQGRKMGHEEYAWRFYLRRLGIGDADVRVEDQIASHLDRLPFYFPRERESGYEWAKEKGDVCFVHPMAREKIVVVYAEQLKSIYSFLESGGFSDYILSGIEDTDLRGLVRLFWNLSVPHVAKLQGISTHIGTAIIPADTRVPYHTVVDHLEMTAALKAVGGTDRAALLVFNLRGVQEFIARAVKAKDLWAGSMLVAMLMMEAIGVIVREYGPQNVIYPSLHMNAMFAEWVKENLGEDLPLKVLGTGEWFDEKVPSLPNKLVAIVARDEVEDVVREMIEAVEGKWRQLVEETYDWFKGQKGYEVVEDKGQWLKQASVFPTVAYAYLPLEDEAVRRFLTPDRLAEKEELFKALRELEKEGLLRLYRTTSYAFPLYGYASEALDNKLNVAKDYQPPRPYEGIGGFERYPHIEKSDTGSGFEAVVRTREDDPSRRERMDVFTAVRRYLASSRGFGVPSVSEIAALELVMTREEELQERLEDIKRLAERVSDRATEAGYPVLEKYLENAPWSSELDRYVAYLGLTQALWRPEDYGLTPEDIKQALGVSPEKVPCRVALLMMDGDKMGAWVGMKFKEIAESVEGMSPEFGKLKLSDFIHPQFADYFEKEVRALEEALGDKAHRLIAGPFWHKTISSALAWFSALVPFVVKKHRGYLIYAGGDDVMVLFPPSRVVDAACDIKRLYQGRYGRLHVGSVVLDIRDGFVFLQKMGSEIPIGILPGRFMTISAGVYTSHFKHPLRLMVDGARRAERLAKEKRNAIGIIAMQRSGKELRAVGSYEKVEEIVEIYREFFLKEENGESRVSSRFIYEFATDGRDFIKPDVATAMGSPVGRQFVEYILRRKSKDEKDPELKRVVDVLWDEDRQRLIDNFGLLRVVHYLYGKDGDGA